jgi:hypothetical protein
VAPIRSADSQVDATLHVCAFFNSDDEEYRILLPCISDELDCGDKALDVFNPDQRHSHLQRLDAVGIDRVAAQQSGQCELRTNTETYLRLDHFDRDRMLTAFDQIADSSSKGAFPRSRIVGRMGWTAEGGSHVDDLVEFEPRANDIWYHHDHAVIYTYHLGQCGGDTVMDVMRTHPMVLNGGPLHKNPLSMPPEEFLDELRERRGRRRPGHAAAR